MAEAKHHCSRCGETGDPRTCNCMRQLRRYLDEAREELGSAQFNVKSRMLASAHLGNAERLLDLLGLDAGKARGRR